MIQIINEELFDVKTTKEENNYGEYFKTVYNTGFSVKHKNSGESSPRIITTLISEKENPQDTKVAIQSSPNKLGNIRVSLKANDKNKYDTNAYLIAVPFNGFIQEIEKSFGFRIYRGFIVHSDKKNIEFGGETFKKVAYMIVVPNEGMFKEDHKYHTDEIKLNVVSYNLVSNEEENEEGELVVNNKTVKSTATITFKKDDFSYEVTKEDVEPINPDDFKNKIVFPIFKDVNGRTKERKNYRRDNQERNYQGVKVSKPADLDSMLEKFNKDYKDNQKDSYNNNKNKGKRGRR